MCGADGQRGPFPVRYHSQRDASDVLLTFRSRLLTEPHLILGIDAGGSKTLLRGERDGESTPIEIRGPGANPMRCGMDEAIDVLVTLVREAIAAAPAVECVSICAGVSGAGRSEEQGAVETGLRDAFADSDMRVRAEVVHDALIALDAAYDTGSGLVLIAGTGSVVLARSREGAVLRAGGWGHLLGDPGSGYAISRAGLRAVAEAFDGGENTTLRARVQTEYDIADRDQLIRHIYQDDFLVQSVAPLVVNAARDDDPVAEQILVNEASALADQVRWLVNREDRIQPRMTMLGGMVQNAYYAQILRRTLREDFPDWSVEILGNEPVRGAVRRARRIPS